MGTQNYWSTWRVSCDWPCHIARGSGGGTDYAVSVGTPIQASFDGVLTNRPPVQFPASGNTAILTRADGVAFYHLHLSAFVSPGPVSQGDVIGYTGGAYGAPGSGSSTGPHLHANAFVENAIRDVHDFFITTASSNATPISPTQRKVNPVLSVTRILRKGVGEFIMFTSATRVSLSREISVISATDRAFELGVASTLAVAVGLPAEIPVMDDTANGGWFYRNQLAGLAAGMPADYPLAPGNPFTNVIGATK